MPTNYGYVKQDVDSQLNWAEVGKSFTDMLTAENTRRDTLKKEIDDNTRADLKRLSNIPRGGSEEMNRWTSSASDAITKQLLMYENALKTGKMDLKDYNTATANVRSGTKNMTTTIKSYNQWYEEGMKRAEAGDAQAAELWKNSLIESMKFKDTTPNIAYDGTMSVTKLVPSKTTSLLEISENPADSFSFSSILDFGKEKFDKFKADEKLNELAKVAGEYVNVYNSGNIGTISDVFQKDSKGNYINKSGVDALSVSIDGMLSNDVNKMSILTDYLPANPKTGKTFEFTLDPNDPRLKGANRDNIILMDKNNKLSPILTESQKKMAHDAMMKGLQARLGRVETPYEKPRQQQWEAERGDIQKEKERAVNFWNAIVSSNDDEGQLRAINAVLGTDEARARGLMDIDFETDPGFMWLRYKDSSLDRKIETGRMTRLEWNKLGSDVHGVGDERIIKQVLGKNANQQLNYWNEENTGGQESLAKVRAKREGEKNANAAFTDEVVNKVPSDFLYKQDNKNAAGALNKAFKGTGINFEPNSTMGVFGNDIKVTYGDKTTIINSNGRTISEARNNLSKLQQFLEAIPEEDKVKLLKSGKIDKLKESVIDTGTLEGGNER